MKPVKYFHKSHICPWYCRRFVTSLSSSSLWFVHLLFQIFSAPLPDFLSSIFIYLPLFSFFIFYFFLLAPLLEYQDRLNITLIWLNNRLLSQYDRLNFKPFFHHLKRTTRSCEYDLNDRLPSQHDHLAWSTR